jgi:hypothetical protein
VRLPDNYQGTWIYDRLKHMGYTGSYDTIKVYVRNIKEQQARLAYVRFETEPGLQAQVDWGDFQILFKFRRPTGKRPPFTPLLCFWAIAGLNMLNLSTGVHLKRLWIVILMPSVICKECPLKLSMTT